MQPVNSNHILHLDPTKAVKNAEKEGLEKEAEVELAEKVKKYYEDRIKNDPPYSLEKGRRGFDDFLAGCNPKE